MVDGIHFYGFLHLHDGESSSVNSRPASFRRLVRVYAENALVTSRSLASAGQRFTLLTNHPDLIERYAPHAAAELEIVSMDFSTRVPSGVRFFSGHYKLDVLRFLGEQADDYSVLIDLDVVCVNPLPPSLRLLAEDKVALAYDISDQLIPAYGEDALAQQLSAILGRPRSARWYGGEFLGGTPDFFRAITKAADSIFERYLDVSVGKARVGNEPYQNAALAIVGDEGFPIHDAGPLGIIGRYWNMPVKHPQRSFRYFQTCFLLHLPVDKHVISLISRFRPGSPRGYLRLYRALKWLWLPLELRERAHKLLSVVMKRS